MFVGLKVAQNPDTRYSGRAIAVVFTAISGTLLCLAQRAVPIGTDCAVWTGIGVAGTFIMGGWFYGDPTSLLRCVGAILIIAGDTAMKLA